MNLYMKPSFHMSAMNTEGLRQRFPETYRRFFLDHEVVVSADLCFPLTPGLAWQAGAPEVYLKLPARAYVGLVRHGKEGSIFLDRMWAYDPAQDAIVPSVTDLLPRPVVHSFLQKWIQEVAGHDDIPGVKVDVFLEAVEQRGFSSPLASLLITALRLFYRVDDISAVDSLSKDVGSTVFTDTHIQAIQLRSDCFFGTAHGTKEFAGITASLTPCMYVAEERGGSIQKPMEDLFPLDVTGATEHLLELRWWGRSLETFGCQGTFPLDLVIFGHGGERDSQTVAAHMRQSIIPQFDELRDLAQTWFGDIFGSGGGHLPAFLKSIGDGEYFQQFIRGHTFKHLALIRALIDLYDRPLDSPRLLRLLETIDSMLNSHAPFVESPSDYTQYYIRLVKQLADELGVPVAVRALHWGKQDGALCVYSAPNTFREPLFELLAQHANDANHPAHVEFVSWRDGFGSEGLRVDQAVEYGRIAQMLGEGILKLATWRKSEGFSSRLVDRKKEVPVDVLFDLSSHRVMVAGKPVTSRELPSQKATVDIFRTLFHRLDHDVPSHELSSKTYTAFRNDLQGKIVGPLHALIQDRCGKPLGVRIHGSLTDFSVIWQPTGLSVGLLEHLS